MNEFEIIFKAKYILRVDSLISVVYSLDLAKFIPEDDPSNKRKLLHDIGHIRIKEPIFDNNHVFYRIGIQFKKGSKGNIQQIVAIAAGDNGSNFMRLVLIIEDHIGIE
jgi:hypothetical protein